MHTVCKAMQTNGWPDHNLNIKAATRDVVIQLAHVGSEMPSQTFVCLVQSSVRWWGLRMRFSLKDDAGSSFGSAGLHLETSNASTFIIANAAKQAFSAVCRLERNVSLQMTTRLRFQPVSGASRYSIPGRTRKWLLWPCDNRRGICKLSVLMQQPRAQR